MKMAITFSVIPRKQELIVPAKPTPRETKTVSDIDDQESLRIHYPIIMFYENNHSMEGLDPVQVVREALAETLVHYYPFAGRLIEGPGNRLLVDCTAEGVVFVEADAAVSLHQLGDTVLPPCPYPELLLNVPGSDGIIGCPLLLVQVTRFKCGGLALAIRFNHVLSDAVGSYQFVTAMTEITKGASTPSIPPVWERNLLTARRPPRVTHSHPEYEAGHQDGAVPPSMRDGALAKKSFSFGPQQIEAIRRKLPPDPERRSGSKFDLITACVWRSRARALRYGPDDRLRIACAVNLRGKDIVDLPSGYYGNAVIHPAGVTTARSLCCGELGFAVNLVREARRRATGDYARSAVDYIAMKRRSKITNTWNFVVSDLSKVGFDEIDFGWGKPMYGGSVDGGTFDYAAYGRCRNRRGEEEVVVAVALPVAVMERFENELTSLLSWETVENYNFNYADHMAYSRL